MRLKKVLHNRIFHVNKLKLSLHQSKGKKIKKMW